MAENLYNLSGERIPDYGKPVPDVVEIARWILEAAEAGEIRGLYAVWLHSDHSSDECRAGVITYGAVGRMAGLQRRMLADMEER
ncbi:MAG: hypothetical protein ACRDHG_09245 [Anaerolineales bacterium]